MLDHAGARNGDGKLDLAVTGVGADQKNLGTTVAIHLGRGDDSFNPPRA